MHACFSNNHITCPCRRKVIHRQIYGYMKNVFAKLDAGSRKQVVQRARILGLLESA